MNSVRRRVYDGDMRGFLYNKESAGHVQHFLLLCALQHDDSSAGAVCLSYSRSVILFLVKVRVCDHGF